MARNIEIIRPSLEEIGLLAHVEQLYEQHRHRLLQPLLVTVTDAGGEITEYEYRPESQEELDMFRLSQPSPAQGFSFPVVLQIVDAHGRCVEATINDPRPLPEWLKIVYLQTGKA